MPTQQKRQGWLFQWIRRGLFLCLMGSAVTGLAVSPWTTGPAQLSPYQVWMAEDVNGVLHYAHNPDMTGAVQAHLWEADGITFVRFQEMSGAMHSWSMCSIMAVLDPSEPGADGDSPASESGESRSRTSRRRETVPDPVTVFQAAVRERQRAYRFGIEVYQTQEEGRTQINDIETDLNGQKSTNSDNDRSCYTDRCCCFSPPGEALRTWRYRMDASLRYGETRLRLPGMDAAPTARDRGIALSGSLGRDRTALILGLSHVETKASGIFEPLEQNETAGRSLLRYRALMRETDFVDLDVFGSAALSRVRFVHDRAPDFARDTTYATPGAGLALGGVVPNVGHFRLLYLYQHRYALGSNRRQVTGDRDIRLHNVGISYGAPVWRFPDSVLWSDARLLYQYLPGLPSGYDADSLSAAWNLTYRRRDRWGAGVGAEHVFSDDLQGRNWKGRVTAHRNF